MTAAEIQKAKSLSDQVYEYLRAQILCGNMKPGTRIVESVLARQLKISRSPIREAVQLLKKDGLLQQENGRILVFRPSADDFQELYELRLAVEPIAVELATGRIQAHELEQIAGLLISADQCLQRGEIDKVIELNSLFHEQLIRFSRNGRFQRMMTEIASLVRYYRTFVFKVYKRNIETNQEHWAIYRAVKEGDAALARKRMESHIKNDLHFILMRSGERGGVKE
ncbi:MULTISPECIES: GntR family transcriptional regulator [Thermoactinomyces]|jgi:DNA-binding GntR family transcriptional regulator|uniref:GntR family transcriptional regulator n=1 Tax=Thermoactinomyces daqus TaxID=1329516 RepID=A0A7W1XBC4_9BACL|nr:MULTISPECIES: GntR family transcriptional regulator [Thermoactinomyces]MBA4543500.1 GntR family transcriptional regulator [Thermoactinomyces daqus]MBH8597231.1 GntR family transcriptional regulator [Thermoactinomyces sp. CICC 10523]MBH8602792.1 GntR family transcriptional regulator [Thermoactinomyces sp. CICC 10522]MBH8606100.1 GntR family transcriptional regulator [Thermoactinomyces sp. CICC 10521]